MPLDRVDQCIFAHGRTQEGGRPKEGNDGSPFASHRPGDHPALPNRTPRRFEMHRNVGDRYKCEECGAVLVYEEGCPCPPEMEHKEICCGQQMEFAATK
jgi:hypothetical protein